MDTNKDSWNADWFQKPCQEISTETKCDWLDCKVLIQDICLDLHGKMWPPSQDMLDRLCAYLQTEIAARVNEEHWQLAWLTSEHWKTALLDVSWSSATATKTSKLKNDQPLSTSPKQRKCQIQHSLLQFTL